MNDARAIADLLRDPDYCGYPRENVQLLLDADATLAGLRAALARVAETTDADSTVTLYFSCHGGRAQYGVNTGEYLLPVDADLASPRALAASTLSSAEFTAALEKIPARKLVVIFDCCYAGGIGETKDAGAPSFQVGALEETFARLKRGRGRVILAASRRDEYAWVLGDAPHSLFTQHLLAGLRGGAPSEDGLITIFALYRYVQPRVTADEPNQHPVFRAEVEDDFPVALFRGGELGTIPRDAQGFVYDAYLSYADQEPDAEWVWETLVPRLRAANLRIAVAHDVEKPAIARVINIERAVQESKFTVLLISPAYLQDGLAEFTNIIAQTLNIDERAYRLLPVVIQTVPLPPRLAIYERLDLTRPTRAEREMQRLIRTLQEPVEYGK